MNGDRARGSAGMSGAAEVDGGRRRKVSAGSDGRRRGSPRASSRVLSPGLEGLEDRRLLTSIGWNTSAAPTGGDWNVAANWKGGIVPGPSDTPVIEGLESPGIVYLNASTAASVAGLTTDSSTTLEVITGSLSLGVASFSTLGGPVTVEHGATLSMGAGASVTVGGTLTDDGLVQSEDDTFTGTGSSSAIAVGSGGELTAAGCTFGLNQVSFDDSSVMKAGDLAGDVFNTPLFLPLDDVPYLTGNASFEDVNINAGTSTSPVLHLNQIGANSSSLRYVFPAGFTVAAQTEVDVGPNVSVLVGGTLTDDGLLTFAYGDTVSLNGSSIAIGGAMDATDDTFTSTGGTSAIDVASLGELGATGCTFDLSQISLDNNSVLKGNDLVNDVFNTPLAVPYNDVQYLAGNASFQDVDINAGTMASGTLSLNQIGSNSSSLRYVLPGGFTVAVGATAAVGPNVNVLLEGNLTDSGVLTFAAGDAVSLSGSTITVSGTMAATGDTFTSSGGTSSIDVGAPGHLLAAGCTFDLSQLSLDNGSVLNAGDLVNDVFNTPLAVPFGDVAYLANNASFQDIDINAGTISSGTLNLNQIGASSSSLRYVFPSGFTVAAGATLAVGPNVNVLVNGSLTDNGALRFASGDTVSFYGSSIVVGGAMSATDAAFTNSGYSSTITVNSGGSLAVSGGAIDLSAVTLNSGSTDTLNATVLSGILNVNSAATINITGDDFSNVGNQGIVATGDPNAQIPLAGNYWGTTVAAQIAAKILDHGTDPTRPTVDYQPFVSGPSGTSASPASIAFSPGSQLVSLDATVTTAPAPRSTRGPNPSRS